MRIFAVLLLMLASGCAPQSRMGMVVDPETGLQMGSVVERNIVLDSSQFENRRLKLTIRNTSGDDAFALQAFRAQLERAFAAKGYSIATDDDFGVLIDINVRYSGQATRDRAVEFGILGGAAGGLAGAARSPTVTTTGASLLAGATLGTIIGSYQREETFLVIADVVVGVNDPKRGSTEKTIVFSSSPSLQDKNEKRSGIKPFEQRLGTGVAVYAGGRNASQRTIAEGVRQRFVRILSDVI